MSITNFKYVGVFKGENRVIDTKNIIKGSSFAEKQAKEVMTESKGEPWKEVAPTASRNFAVKLVCK